MGNQELFPKRDTTIFICPRGRRATPQCRYCNRPSTKYCDYAIDKSMDNYKTCDAPMCERCAFHLPGGVDYCRLHKPDTAITVKAEVKPPLLAAEPKDVKMGKITIGNYKLGHRGIYIGRYNKSHGLGASPLCNPIPLNKNITPAQNLILYKQHLWKAIQRAIAPDASFRDKVIYREQYRDWETDRKSTRLNSSHEIPSRMPSSA